MHDSKRQAGGLSLPNELTNEAVAAGVYALRQCMIGEPLENVVRLVFLTMAAELNVGEG